MRAAEFRSVSVASLVSMLLACASGRTATVPKQVAVPRPDATRIAMTLDTTWYITNRARVDGELGRALADSLEFGLVVTRYRERVGPGSDGRFLEDINAETQDSARFSAEEFVVRLRDRSAGARRPEGSAGGTIVYVHGYAVSFGRGIRQGAEIAHRGTHDGPMVVFSWPSHSGMVTWPSVSRAYREDSTSAAASHRAFRDALAVISRAVHPGSLSVVGHSLGGSLVAEALAAPGTRRDPLVPSPLRSLVLFAPDISLPRLEDSLADALRPVAVRRVVYASDDDFMMDVSRIVNRSTRAGEATPARSLTSLGFEVVDVARGRRANGALRKMFEPGHAMRIASSALYDFFSVVRGVPETCRGVTGLAQRADDGSWWLSDAPLPSDPPGALTPAVRAACGSR